jgi:Tol biopolymer transport system component
LSLTLPGKEGIVRGALPILAACLVAGCGARSGTPSPESKGPGLLVFGGVPDPSARHPPIAHYALRPDGEGLRKLAFSPDDGDLSFSPDGRFAAMWVPTGRGVESTGSRLVVSRADGSERHVVPLPKGSTTASPSLSPDGKTVAMAYLPAGSAQSFQLWTVSVDGQGLRRVGGREVVSVAWSPDGSRIAYVDDSGMTSSSEGAVGDLYVVRPDGSDLRKVVQSFSGLGQEVSWSPDGKRLAFEDKDQRISIVDADGGDSKALAPDGETPAWSPDGKRVAFLRVRTCGSYGLSCLRAQILVVDVESGAITPVGSRFGGAVSLAWTTASVLPRPKPSASKPSS